MPRRLALLTLLLLSASMLTGCAGVKRAWNALVAPAQAETPSPRPSPWVPLGNPYMQPAAPYWPTSPVAAAGQADALAVVVQELDHVMRLVHRASRMPPEPGEYRINWFLIEGDISTVREGIVDAIRKQRASAGPRDYPPMNRDYLE